MSTLHCIDFKFQTLSTLLSSSNKRTPFMFINKPKYAEHTQTESLSYFFCCDLRCRRCPRHADDIISNYKLWNFWRFSFCSGVDNVDIPTSQHSRTQQLFLNFYPWTGLVMMRYNLKITFSLKCHPHIPRVSCREYRLLLSATLEPSFMNLFLSVL